jgi:hypothetical protein
LDAGEIDVDDAADDAISFETGEELDSFIDALAAAFDTDEEEDGFNVGCVCHRLQLVVTDFTKQVPAFRKLRKVCKFSISNLHALLGCLCRNSKVC